MEEWRRVPFWRRSRGRGRPPIHQRPRSSETLDQVNDIPQWEKEFLASVLPISWEEFKSAKKTMYFHKNILEWDDSAGLEVFQSAKNRYWSKINNFPCDVPLPDADKYIDQVDHDEAIDPELVADLYVVPVPASSTTSVPDPCAITDVPIIPTGWGDAESLVHEPKLAMPAPLPGPWYPFVVNDEPIIPTGWGDAEDPVPAPDPAQSSNWDLHLDEQIKPTGWGEEENFAWNANVESSNAWNHRSWGRHRRYGRGNGGGAQNNRRANNRKREGGGGYSGAWQMNPRNNANKQKTKYVWRERKAKNAGDPANEESLMGDSQAFQ